MATIYKGLVNKWMVSGPAPSGAGSGAGRHPAARRGAAGSG